MLADIIQGEAQSGRKDYTLNSVAVAAQVYEILPITARSRVAEGITGGVLKAGVISQVWDLPVARVMEVLQDAPEWDSKQIVKGFVDGLSLDKGVRLEEFFDGLVKVERLLETEDFEAVENFLGQVYGTPEARPGVVELVQRVRESDRVRRGLCSRPDGFVGKMVEGITPDNPDASQPYAEFFMSVVDVAHVSNREHFVRKLGVMLMHHPEPGWHPTREFGVKYLERLEVDFIPASTVPELTAALRRAIDLVPESPGRLRLVRILVRLYNVLPEPGRQQVNTEVPIWADQFGKDEIMALRALAQDMDQADALRAGIASGFANRLTRPEARELKEALIEGVIELDGTPEKTIFRGAMNTLLDGSPEDCEIGTNAMVNNFNTVPEEERQATLRDVQRRARQAEADRLGPLVGAHAALAQQADEVVLEDFADLLVQLMMSDDLGKRDCGVRSYQQIRDLLDAAKKRMVAYQLIRFLSARTDKIDDNYCSLMDEVVRSGRELTATQRSDFVQILRSLMPATNPHHQRMIAADYLPQVKPFPKKQRKDTLEDLKQFMQSEETPEELRVRLEASYEAIR